MLGGMFLDSLRFHFPTISVICHEAGDNPIWNGGNPIE